VIWLVRSIIPVDRFRFVRTHLRRGVRYDSGFRWIHIDDEEDDDMVDQQEDQGQGRRRRTFSTSAGKQCCFS